jgi:hypothetical protein
MSISPKRGEKTTWQQRSAIIQWLNVPFNFQLFTGTKNLKGVIAGTLQVFLLNLNLIYH